MSGIRRKTWGSTGMVMPVNLWNSMTQTIADKKKRGIQNHEQFLAVRDVLFFLLKFCNDFCGEEICNFLIASYSKDLMVKKNRFEKSA